MGGAVGGYWKIYHTHPGLKISSLREEFVCTEFYHILSFLIFSFFWGSVLAGNCTIGKKFANKICL